MFLIVFFVFSPAYIMIKAVNNATNVTPQKKLRGYAIVAATYLIPFLIALIFGD